MSCAAIMGPSATSSGAKVIIVTARQSPDASAEAGFGPEARAKTRARGSATPMIQAVRAILGSSRYRECANDSGQAAA